MTRRDYLLDTKDGSGDHKRNTALDIERIGLVMDHSRIPICAQTRMRRHGVTNVFDVPLRLQVPEIVRVSQIRDETDNKSQTQIQRTSHVLVRET